jgi:hypothetical protein
MLMIGDMFNDRLKARVAALCIDVADALGEHPVLEETDERSSAHWWPTNFGAPINRGLSERHAVRILPEQQAAGDHDNGKMSTYDTGDHVIVGVSQRKGPLSCPQSGASSFIRSWPGNPERAFHRQSHAQSIVFSRRQQERRDQDTCFLRAAHPGRYRR